MPTGSPPSAVADGVFNAIKDGSTTIDAAFPEPEQPATSKLANRLNGAGKKPALAPKPESEADGDAPASPA